MIRSRNEWVELTAKLQGADQHIRELHHMWIAFRHDSYRVAHQDNFETGKRIYYLDRADEPSSTLRLKVGDAVHNLRSALDHLAYRAMSVSPGVTAKNLRNTYFPIGKDPAEYKSQRARIKTMREDAKKAIDAVEPYGGGAGEIVWHLHALDVADKHHLVIAIGSTNRMHSMSPRDVAAYKKAIFGARASAFTPAQDALYFQTARPEAEFPLKAGHILMAVPINEVNEHMHFTFEIAFGEPEGMNGVTVLTALNEMLGRIRTLFFGFNEKGFFE